MARETSIKAPTSWMRKHRKNRVKGRGQGARDKDTERKAVPSENEQNRQYIKDWVQSGAVP